MKLYIKIVENLPVEHPIMENNFRQAFPDIDTENLPSGFANFERVGVPTIGVYEVYDGVTYEWVDGIVKDVHHVRDMTGTEKINLQEEVKSNWAENGFASWIFNEETCLFDPPVAYPDDDNVYTWNEEQVNWQLFENENPA